MAETLPQMCHLYTHTQTLSPQMAEVFDEGALWRGLMRFVHQPEKFNDQIRHSTVRPVASDRPGSVFERTLDFGSHSVRETVYLNESALTMEFHAQESKEFSSALLRVGIIRTQEGLPAVRFSYFSVQEPDVPKALRRLLEQAWEQKDQHILEQILLDEPQSK